jgi:hypothetical protein
MAAPRLLGGLLLWLVLLAGGVAFALWPKEPSRRPIPGDVVLLDTGSVAMGSDGALFAFRVERPGTVEVDVDLTCPDDPAAATHVLVGPPAPVPPPAGNHYPPDPKTAHRWRIEGDRTPPVRRTLFSVGTYAVKVEPKPVAMGDMPPSVRIRVTVVP